MIHRISSVVVSVAVVGVMGWGIPALADDQTSEVAREVASSEASEATAPSEVKSVPRKERIAREWRSLPRKERVAREWRSLPKGERIAREKRGLRPEILDD